MRLPAGTVTFLFTDVEGSTRLLQEHGDGYAALLAEHRRILRDAFARNGGVEVDTQGDAFFVAFARASDALAAAAEGQRGLAAGPLHVRMGLHTGEPVLTAEGYVGMDVHRAARIAAVGHGGQVLVSQATRDLAGIDGLRDLGEHRLKDLSAPERIYQLGDDEFPPLKSLFQTNVPVQATPLVGRQREVAAVLELLRGSRFVTLTGPGGSGKTRLALEVAAQTAETYVDGVWFVSLAAVVDPALVEPTIAQVLGVRTDLADHLAGRDVLLVLDNLEQLLPQAATTVSSLPSKLLVTSRERLNLALEQEYPVPTLPLAEGIALFVQRARQLRPDFQPDPEVASIVRRLDGLPLAVELAAARVKVLPPEQIVARLGKSLDLLTSGTRDAPERQRTLRATIEWSYDLLDEDERLLFARLSVFAGSFDFDAAEAVAAADLDALGSLVDKSLLRHADPARFSMLETIREYAAELLRARGLTQVGEIRRAHALHYVALAERVEPELRGPDQRAHLERLELEHDNLRAALSWARESSQAEIGLRLASAIWRFWRTHNHLAEGTRALDGLLQIGGDVPAPVRARALVGASRLALDQGNVDDSLAFGKQALAAARSSDAGREVAAATENLGVATFVAGAKSRAVVLLEDSVARFRALDDPVATADALNNLGNALLDVGDGARAACVLEESLALQREAGNARGIEFVLHTLGYVALYQGDVELARTRLEESLLLSQELGHLSGIAWSLEGLAQVAARGGGDRRAVALWAAGTAIRAEAGAYMQPTEAAIHDSALSLARSRLGESAFASAWLHGTAFACEDAVAYALTTVD